MRTKLLLLALIGLATIGGLILASSLDPIFAGQDSKKKKKCFGSEATKKQCKELLRRCIEDPTVVNLDPGSTKKDCKDASRNRP